jgi:hypothetical protein
MNGVINNIKDPSWWFTAVIVAIFASLFAAYIKDLIGRGIASLSGKYNRRRQEQQEREKKLVADIADDPTRLLVSLGLLIINIVTYQFLTVSAGFTYLAIIIPSSGFYKSQSATFWMTLIVFFDLITGYTIDNRRRRFFAAFNLYKAKKQERNSIYQQSSDRFNVRDVNKLS